MPGSPAAFVACMLRLLGDDHEIVEVGSAGIVRPLRSTKTLYAICVRRPLAEDDLALWFGFVEDALERTIRRDRVVLAAEDVFANPLAQLRRLAWLLELPERADDPAVGRALARLHVGKRPDWISPSSARSENVPLGAEAVYDALRRATDAKALVGVRSLVRKARADHIERRKLQDDLTRLRAHMAASEGQVEAEHRRLKSETAALKDAVASLQALADSVRTAVSARAGHNGSTADKRKQYARLIEKLRRTVETVVPAGSTVAVVSRGDPELLQLEGRSARHFPQAPGGGYAGYHPADSAAAIAQLAQIRELGASYVVFPATAGWWFEHYTELKQHLDSCHELVADEDGTCVIYRLHAPRPVPPAYAGPERRRRNRGLVRQMQELVTSLIPPDASVAVIAGDDAELLMFDGMTTFGIPFASDTSEPCDPADGEEAVAELEAARARGARFLLIPSSSSWWLDRYHELAQHLDSRYRLITRQRHVCSIYDLAAGPPTAAGQHARLRHLRDFRRTIVG